MFHCSLMWYICKSINIVVTTCLFLSLYHVWCVLVFPSLSYTNMHILNIMVVVQMCSNKVWEFSLLQGLHSIALPSFVRISLSISELHQCAYSHCSFLWCEKCIVYQQVIRILVSYHLTLPVYHVSCIQAFRYESYTNMHALF